MLFLDKKIKINVQSEQYHSLIHSFSCYLSWGWTWWYGTQLSLSILLWQYLGDVVGRRDDSIKEEWVNHMWQDLKKSGGYWEAPGLPHQGTVHGEPLRGPCTCVSLDCLQGLIRRKINMYLFLLPFLELKFWSLEEWWGSGCSILCRQKESFDWKWD